MADLKPLLSKSLLFPPIGDPPPMQLGGGMSSPMPAIAMPNQPNITVDPHMATNSSDPLFNRGANASSDLADRLSRSQISGLNKPTTTLGKIGHVAANIGNVLGDIFAPATMALIPGTGLNNQVMENRDRNDINDVSQLQTAQSGRAAQAATTAYTEQRPAIEQAKVQQKLISTLGTKGLIPERDDQGNLTGNVVEDENNPAAQSRKIHDDVEQSKDELAQAQAAFTAAKADPNSPLFQQVSKRLQIAQVNASAAVTRAQAYYGNYLQHAFNKDLQGNILPGAPQISDAAGNITTPGSTNAATAIKSNAAAAQFNDVTGKGGALENVLSKAQALEAAGGRLNSPAIVYAMQHASGTPSQVIQSIDKANLTPVERDYVISNLAAHENIQALRKSAGGLSTDSSVAKLDEMLGSGSIPDADYLARQVAQIQATGTRIGKGVATAKGGLTIDTNEKPAGNEPQRPANVPAGYVYNENGPKGKGWYKP